MESKERVTAVFTVWLRKAKQENWGLWKGDDQERMNKLIHLTQGICAELGIPHPTLRLDPAVSAFLGVTYPDSGTILVSKPSVVTTLHELAHYTCHKLGVLNSERNARQISLESFFSVWPKKRGRSDIFYKDEV